MVPDFLGPSLDRLFLGAITARGAKSIFQGVDDSTLFVYLFLFFQSPVGEGAVKAELSIIQNCQRTPLKFGL